jgi:hypothetical protein
MFAAAAVDDAGGSSPSLPLSLSLSLSLPPSLKGMSETPAGFQRQRRHITATSGASSGLRRGRGAGGAVKKKRFPSHRQPAIANLVCSGRRGDWVLLLPLRGTAERGEPPPKKTHTHYCCCCCCCCCC